MSAIPPNTSIAAIGWHGSVGPIHNAYFHRVYYQGTDNYIYEQLYNGPDGWAATPNKMSFKAAPNSPLAAIHFDNSSDGSAPQIRLYYLGEKYTVEEAIYKSSPVGWVKGATLPAPAALPTTRLSVFGWGTYPDVRLYYQKIDLSLQEFVYTESWGGWVAGHTFV